MAAILLFTILVVLIIIGIVQSNSKKRKSSNLTEKKVNPKSNEEWAKLLKKLSECQSGQEMTELSRAIASLGNKEAVPGLVSLMIQSYQSGYKAHEKMQAASMDPQLLLMERLRQQSGILTVGYDPKTVNSPIKEQKEVMSRYFYRGHRALDALVDLGAIEEFQALLDNTTYNNQMRDNFTHAIKRIHEKDSAGSEIKSFASKPADGDTNIMHQSANVSTSETNKGREVTFVIPCGICGYNTDVTVRIDWSGVILSGSSTDHEFHCQNCKKTFTVKKDSLKQYTDRFV